MSKGVKIVKRPSGFPLLEPPMTVLYKKSYCSHALDRLRGRQMIVKQPGVRVCACPSMFPAARGKVFLGVLHSATLEDPGR